MAEQIMTVESDRAGKQQQQTVETSGLGTFDALQRLHKEVTALVEEQEATLRSGKWQRFFAVMQERSSCFTITSFFIVIGIAVSLLVAAFTGNDDKSASGNRAWLIFEAFFLLLSAGLNCSLHALRQQRKLFKHTTLKFRYLEKLKAVVSEGKAWESTQSYPSIHTPISPCISLQWVLREGEMVNLPHPLLVQGDVIVMRPGQPAPAKCTALERDVELSVGEVFCVPSSEVKGEGPQPRVPMSTELFLLQETPIANTFGTLLEDTPSKPCSLLENERHAVTMCWIQSRLLPCVFVISLSVNLLRLLYLDREAATWAEVLIVLQAHGILPLVPIVMPWLWFCVNLVGQEYIFEAYTKFRSAQSLRDTSSESLSSCSDLSVEDTQPSVHYRDLLTSVWQSLQGHRGSASPDFEMLHTLGTVTALCCIDKKGILSWPNPSAEKVFFFSSLPKKLPAEEDYEEASNGKQGRPRKKRSRQDSEVRFNLEVLDVTHDTGKDAFSLMFDDPNWKKHLSALKPLGLDILLNTCQESTSAWYTQFTDHVVCAARENKDTVAVVGRRCLCSLAKEMGFTEKAANIFTREATIGAYRQVPVEEAEREKQNRARSFIQHKIPMPNQVSVVVRDKLSGLGQLMTQGTGDLVLDCCTDAWTGSDLHILSELDRKRVLDFYHRNSMVAYCTAFAYKPLPKTTLDWPDHFYTELMESPSATKVAHGEDAGVFLNGDEEENVRRQRSHSVDSLLELSPSSSVEELRVGQLLQSHQTFLGMISLQYQARQDFVQLISQLESACIKFVHFSKENEVRSRVFAEKMGLEAGWNCHVSLMAVSEPVSSANSSSRNLSSLGQHLPAGAAADVGAGEGGGVATDASDGRHHASFSAGSPQAMPRVHSAPSVVNVEASQVKFATDPLPIVYDDDSGTDYLQEVAVIKPKQQQLLRGQDNCTDASETDALISKDESSTAAKTIITTASITTTTADTSDGLDERKPLLSSGKQKLPSLERTAGDGSWHGKVEAFSNPLMEDRDGASGRNDDLDDNDDAVDVDNDDGSDGDDEDEEDEEEDYDVHSDSRYTSSYVTENTEDSLTGAFDNRARLPRGIENIRPHLKNVDNVPLLVNLFTDCVPEATHEMIQIMQENGEVVLVVGSSLNMVNTPIFIQADCSIAIEPLYPQLCARQPSVVQPWSEEDLSPTQLASMALSLPCPLFFQRHSHMKLIELIMESRHFVLALRNSFHLLLCCMLALVLTQLLCCVMLLPPLLAPQHVLWLVCLVLPALSLSLLGNPNEARTLCLATHKNINLVNKQKVLEFVRQFSLRFLPSILVALVCAVLVLQSFCDTQDSAGCTVYPTRFSRAVNSSDDIKLWTEKFQGGLLLAQNIFHLYFSIFLVAVTVTLVYWQDHLWQKLPFRNIVWSVTAAAVILLQLLFSVADVCARQEMWGASLSLSEVNPAVWIIGCVWPFVSVALNELVKKREIKLALRAQKRARLDFDTKLGMNSPF